jgi:hypothetical protein
MEGAIWLYKQHVFQRGLDNALVGLGEISYRRVLLANAIRAFLQGCEKARQLDISLVESRALLGPGNNLPPAGTD